MLMLVAALVMGIGLVFSFSRGALAATAVGLLYLAWSCGKLSRSSPAYVAQSAPAEGSPGIPPSVPQRIWSKSWLRWRYIIPGLAGTAAVILLIFWRATPDDAPWYIKRLDLARPSAQHRVAAWRAALQMMRDHPFGVGWDKAVDLYESKYSPPQGGAAAITTNDYLMLGTQLGWPGLACFLTYVRLCLRGINSRSPGAKQGDEMEGRTPNNKTVFTRRESNEVVAMACRSTAIVMLVAFWFDGGLFMLPVAALFWILLELGVEIESHHHDAVNVFRAWEAPETGATLQKALTTPEAEVRGLDMKYAVEIQIRG
jgi:O-antigen ligase